MPISELGNDCYKRHSQEEFIRQTKRVCKVTFPAAFPITAGAIGRRCWISRVPTLHSLFLPLHSRLVLSLHSSHCRSSVLIMMMNVVGAVVVVVVVDDRGVACIAATLAKRGLDVVKDVGLLFGSPTTSSTFISHRSCSPKHTSGKERTLRCCTTGQVTVKTEI